MSNSTLHTTSGHLNQTGPNALANRRLRGPTDGGMELTDNYNIPHLVELGDTAIAKGAYGEVVPVVNDKTDLVVKIIQTKRLSLVELGLLAGVRHPHLSHARFIVSNGHRVYIGLERAVSDFAGYWKSEYGQRDSAKLYRASQSARRHLPTVKQALGWFWDVTVALASLHQLRIVHGDVKASNVLMMPSGSLVLADFGMAATDYPELTEYNRRLAELRVGTPSHLAPEVTEIQRWSFELDIWALGCTFYEMFYGHSLFQATSTDLARSHSAWSAYLQTNTKPKDSGFRLHPDFGLNGPVDALITSMLVLEPAERPTAAQVLNYLQRYLGKRALPGMQQPKLKAVTTKEFAYNYPQRVPALVRAHHQKLCQRYYQWHCINDVGDVGDVGDRTIRLLWLITCEVMGLGSVPAADRDAAAVVVCEMNALIL